MEHLSAGGVSVVIDDQGQVVHWGAALSDDPPALAAALTPPLPRASFDVPVPLTLTPSPSRGLARPPRRPRGVRPLCSTTVEICSSTEGSDPPCCAGVRADRGGGVAVAAVGPQRRRRAVRCWVRWRASSPCPPSRPRCSTSPAAGAASGIPSGGRSTRAPGCGRRGTAGRDMTRRCCWSRAPRASGSGTARCGASTWAGAATRRGGPSGCPTARRCWARRSSARWWWSRARSTRHRGSTRRGRTRGSTG